MEKLPLPISRRPNHDATTIHPALRGYRCRVIRSVGAVCRFCTFIVRAHATVCACVRVAQSSPLHPHVFVTSEYILIFSVAAS